MFLQNFRFIQELDIRGNNIKHIPLEVGKLRNLFNISYDKDQTSENIWKGFKFNLLSIENLNKQYNK